jgi:hypothetical protein
VAIEKKILARIKRKFNSQKDHMEELRHFDNMVGMTWSLPKGLKEKSWAVKQVDPICHDAEKVALNFFDTYNPKFDILPFGPEDSEAAGERETWLEWQMMRANLHGETEPFREMLKHSVRYNQDCVQVDYLPYWLPRDRDLWTDLQKEAVNDSPFVIPVNDPKTVYHEMGRYGLRWVAKVANLPAADIIDHYGLYPNADTEQVEGWMKRNEKERVVLVDYTDIDKRYVCCWKVGTSTDINPEIFSSSDVVDIISGKNELGFINWIIATGSSDALFASLHRGNLWENANLSASILRSNLFRRSFFPFGKKTGGAPNQPVEMDVPTGAQFDQFQTPPLDPAWSQLSAQDRAIMAQSTSIQTLQGVQPQSNVQFATVNAFIQLSLTSLEPYKRTVEKVLAAAAKMMFKWLKASEDRTGGIELGYRTQPTKTQRAGQKIAMSAADFDPDKMFITATLIPNTPTDRLQLANIALQLIQSGMPIPMAEHMERLGYSNPAILKQDWETEQVDKAALGAFIQQMQAMAQLQVQAQQMQMQMAQQQQMAQSTPQPMLQGAGGQGFNPAQGGTPPAEAAPQLTQTQIQSQGGGLPGGGAISNPGAQ